MATNEPKGENPTDDANPYTNPTGDGYAGVYRVAATTRNVETYLSQTEAPWPAGTTIAVLRGDDRLHAVPLGDADRADETIQVRTDRTADRYLAWTAGALALLDVPPGGDVRLYDRGDEPGLTLVARDADPFVDGGEA